MSRTTSAIFQIAYVIEFTCDLPGHHVHKFVWNPVEADMLFWQKESPQEAVEYDTHKIGVFKSDIKLVGHMLIELFNLIDYFLGNTEENRVYAVVVDQRKKKLFLYFGKWNVLTLRLK